MWLFCQLHDNAVQRDPLDNAVYKDLCRQNGRVYFSRMQFKGRCQLLPIMEMVLEHVVWQAGAELLLHVWHWNIQSFSPA